jgi:hypothetical protein
MYKTFTTRFGTDPETKVFELREEFPKCYYKAGVRKGERGIWAIHDLDHSDYSVPFQTPENDWFYGPGEVTAKKVIDNLNDYKTTHEDRLIVKTICGKELEIFPASCIPRVAFLSKRSDNNDTYNRRHKYGAKAYELYLRSQTEKTLLTNDPQFLDFVSTALEESYVFPRHMWDILEIVSDRDFDAIFLAGMGVVRSEEDKKK